MDARYKKIRNIMILILVLNLAVSVVKIIYGKITNTLSMQSDGYHSMFDGISNVVGLIGIQAASKPPDTEHPYGHRKFETMASVFIAVLLMFVGFKIVSEAFGRFGNGSLPEVTAISFMVMIGTMTVNYLVTTYEHRNGVKLQSEVLIADSMHTKSDIYVSLSVILGLIAIKAGFPILDPIIAIVISVIIFYAAISIIIKSASILCDTSQLDVKEVYDVVCEVDGVMGCHNIRTRGVAGHIYIDLHMEVHPNMPTHESHSIADTVEYRLKQRFEGVQDVVIHIEPAPLEPAS
ncbi:MAG: cation diffusion facilitator family transporter [Methanomethylovorans sp.]|uniref:cation diffusion facilitator family transporter n=1 Tax=Methanomethylovorans sp. TaxID=2758717 RepID=UPI003530A680